MIDSDEEADRRARVVRLLQLLAEKGVSQQAVAQRVRVSPAYLSDVKVGRRPVTELLMRRLGEAYGAAHPWFLEQTGFSLSPPPESHWASSRVPSLVLPLLPHPVTGPPTESSHWKGTLVELVGRPAVAAFQAEMPYVLELGVDDKHRGRFRQGDHLLMTQDRPPRDDSTVRVVRRKDQLLLARPTADQQWALIRDGSCHAIAPDDLLGAVLGITWGR